MDEHRTNEFVATRNSKTFEAELWIDWVPAVDGNPASAVSAKMDGSDLLIMPEATSEREKMTRRVVGLASPFIQMLENGVVVRICGPSGVLAEHRVLVQGCPKTVK